MEERSEVTQRVLNLTLEILYLLTGEDYIIVKKPGGRTPNSNRLQVVEGFCRKQKSISVPSPCSLPSEKILELTNRMIALLTGEVPIRCQDVTVYFSMEEWEYLEGHKDLYKDVMMEDHQTLLASGGPGSRHPAGDVSFSAVTSDCEAEDCMITDGDLEPDGIQTCKGDVKPQDTATCNGDTGPQCIDMCQEDTGLGGLEACQEDTGLGGLEACQEDPGLDGLETCQEDPRLDGLETCQEDPRLDGLEACQEDTGLDGMEACQDGPEGIDSCQRATSTVEGFQVRIKEEPLSDEEEILADDHYAQQIPYTCVRIKEEPQLFEEVIISSDDADQIPQALCHIKVETLAAEEDSLPTATTYTPRDQRPSTPAHIKEEPGTFINVLDISRHENHTAEHPTNAVPESLAYEVEIPVDKGPVKGPNNPSLYSVRQKEDSMEILYHCPSCYKGFSSNLDLARHQVIHTVDKLFICSLCGKSFTEMSFLVKHQVIHTDLKLCVCPVCGGCFYSETSLAKHQKTHSLPLFCSTCGKCFFNRTELAIHERKHSGERPFGCHICGKHFIAKSVLNKHMLIHTSVDFRK